MRRSIQRKRSTQRRGAVLLLVAVSLVVLIGFAALSIDVGQMYRARTELQRAADAAALAGASAYYTDLGYTQASFSDLSALVKGRAMLFASMNPTLGDPTVADPNDIVLGRFNPADVRAPMDTSGFLPFNGVEVTLRRTPGSRNGPVEFFFAPILGKPFGGVTATAAAMADDRVAGFRIRYMRLESLLPFTIRADLYESMLVNGPDQYSYEGNGIVIALSDGVREICIYPHRIKETKSTANPVIETSGAGNFGTLNIGIDNLGSVGVRDQILYGITAEQLEAEIGSPDLMYYDENGEPITHEITGNTGLSATLESALAERVGQFIGFFIHSDCVLNGSGATFTNTGVRFGRLMRVDLNGAPQNKCVVVQPVPFVDDSVIIKENVPPSDGQVGRCILVR